MYNAHYEDFSLQNVFKGNASNTQLYLISKKFHKDPYFE